MSGILSEEDYEKTGPSHFALAAKAATHDPPFQEASKEFERWAGLWKVDTVFMFDQVSFFIISRMFFCRGVWPPPILYIVFLYFLDPTFSYIFLDVQ